MEKAVFADGEMHRLPLAGEHLRMNGILPTNQASSGEPESGNAGGY